MDLLEENIQENLYDIKFVNEEKLYDIGFGNDVWHQEHRKRQRKINWTA